MIKRLYVHNYRCLENFELNLTGHSSILLIGRNGTGKSTVASALSVLQSITRGVSRVGLLVKSDDFARGRSDVPIRFEVEVELQGRQYEYTLALDLPEDFRELRVSEEALSVSGQTLYKREKSQVSLARTSTDKEAKFLVDWHLIALPIIQERSKTDPLYIFKTWMAKSLILAPVPSQMSGESERESLLPERTLSNFAEWFSGLLANSPAAYSDIDSFLRKVMPDFKEVRNPFSGTDARNIVVQFWQNQTSLDLRFDRLSDGEKCFFVCAVVLAANHRYGPLFCFWDEPDNYLSISEVGHFIMALRRSFHAGGQFVITSHNPEAIRRFSDDNTFVLDRRSHLEPTLIRPLTELQIHGSLIDALIRDDVET